MHTAPAALRADASFDSILRDPGFGVTACAAAAGVDVCAGACAHVRGSAVLGDVDREAKWLKETYEKTDPQIFRLVSEMTGMPEYLVHDYWKENARLTAKTLIDHMRDEKYRLLTVTPRADKGPIAEKYASFLKDTDIEFYSLLAYTDEELEKLELDWLSQQTGFTQTEISQILIGYEQGDDADMSKLGKLRKKKAYLLQEYGFEHYHALKLAKADSNIELIKTSFLSDLGIPCDIASELAQKQGDMQTILDDYYHTRGPACVYTCTRPPDAPVARTCYYAFAPSCALSGVAPCVPACGWHQCTAAAPVAEKNDKDLLSNDDTLKGTKKYKSTFKRDYDLLKFFLPSCIKTKKQFLAVPNWDYFSETIPKIQRKNFTAMSNNFKEEFYSFKLADQSLFWKMRLHVTPKTLHVTLECFDTNQWKVVFTNITNIQIDFSEYKIIFSGKTSTGDDTYNLNVFFDSETFETVKRNLTNIVEISEIVPANTSASGHVTPSNTFANMQMRVGMPKPSHRQDTAGLFAGLQSGSNTRPRNELWRMPRSEKSSIHMSYNPIHDEFVRGGAKKLLSEGNTLIEAIDTYVEQTRDDSIEHSFKLRCAAFEDKFVAWFEDAKQNSCVCTIKCVPAAYRPLQPVAYAACACRTPWLRTHVCLLNLA